MELKKFLRTQNLENRKTFDEAAHFSANNKIVSSVQELSVSLISSKKRDTLDKRGIIGLYWPMKGEPDLLKLAVNSNWIVGLPKIRGTKMDFIRYDVGTELERSNFGKLMQPKNNSKLLPNIIVVPGIAYSLKGDRLGFGVGHYDRYFVKNNSIQSTIKTGVCFHENLYENLPREPHDIQVDYIITYKTIIAI